MYSAAFFLSTLGNCYKNIAFDLEMYKKLLVFGLEMNKKYAAFGLEMKIKLYFINQQSCISMEDELLLRWTVKLY